MSDQQLRKEIRELGKNGAWYQDIPFPFGSVPLAYPAQKNSKCYHLGKWSNFVKPLIPFDNFVARDFLEIGCNAGLYLFEAAKLGFNKIYGVEADKDFYRQLEFTMNHLLFGKQMITHAHVGDVVEFNVDLDGSKKLIEEDLFVVDLTLLANLTYWLKEEDLIWLIKTLVVKSLYVIVVTVNDINEMSSGDCNYLKGLFEPFWEFIDSVDCDASGDPAPRDVTSMLFKSKLLVERSVDEIEKGMLFGKCEDGWDNFCFLKTFSRFVSREFFGVEEKVENTWYYKFLISRGGLGKNVCTSGEIYEYVEKWRELILDLRDNGLRESLKLYNHDGDSDEYIDGYHRMVILEHLNYSRIICTDERKQK